MTVTERLVTSNGVRLAVQQRGDARSPTVILVHGYPDTSAVWDDVAERLADQFHVVAYDVRGAGRSDRPAELAAYAVEQLAADLRAVASAVRPDVAVHLVGHDWGSIQSWEAITEPGAQHRIASYTSVSGPCLDHIRFWIGRGWRSPGTASAVVRQLVKSWYVGALCIPGVAPLVWRRLGLDRRVPRPTRTSRGPAAKRAPPGSDAG